VARLLLGELNRVQSGAVSLLQGRAGCRLHRRRRWSPPGRLRFWASASAATMVLMAARFR
jgi:hypothetical protein